MKIIRKIALTELQTLFYSPVAWLILIVFTFIAAMTFTDVFGAFVLSQDLNYGQTNITLGLLAGMRGLFTNMQGYLYLYIPLLTMSLMSRELSSGSINLLYSSPVKNSQIILGKYLSMLVYGLAMVLVLFVFVLVAAFTVKDFGFPVALSGLMGLYLLICAYAAIGLFMSSLTSYQVVAAIGTLAVLALLNLVGQLGQEYDFVREITYWLAIGGRANESIGGLICSEDILYFLIVSGLFLALSILRLKAIRQKSRWQVSFTKYIGVFALAMLLGYVSSRPRLMAFYDATRTKQQTLTPNSQDIIKRADGGLTMTSYVNILDDNLWSGLPTNRKNDINRFRQYVRFKPEIKMKYVYYYTNARPEYYARLYPGLSDERIVGRISKSSDLDSTMFMPPEAINKMIDLAPESFRLVRLLERENGQKTFLRMFDDMIRYPNETEISAAFKRVVMELPVIGFVTGHGERDINNDGDRGYFRFSQDKPYRYSLINQGFDCEEIRLDAEVPARVNILVIADVRTPISPADQANLDAYIARGGNLVILGETRRQEVMNPLAERFGVKFMPGQLVRYVDEKAEKEEAAAASVNSVSVNGVAISTVRQRSKNPFQADFIQSRVTDRAKEVSYVHEGMHNRGLVVTMPGSVGLTYETDKGYNVIPLLVSDTLHSWNELETTNFIDDTVRVNPAIGEVKASYPTALALTRQVNGREQRILITGDADCLSNGEISMQRAGVPAANYNLIMGAFFWMSNNEVPIDVRRPPLTDNELFISGPTTKLVKYLLMGLFPLLLLAGCLLIWLRRRGR
ncbi:MAG: Gldg family protein [Odoribacteraceae bacterium]|jgi:ABC-2 type transport system permease protein|nr:Gldg family protein [Odoribacteraceae bacterium]